MPNRDRAPTGNGRRGRFCPSRSGLAAVAIRATVWSEEWSSNRGTPGNRIRLTGLPRIIMAPWGRGAGSACTARLAGSIVPVPGSFGDHALEVIAPSGWPVDHLTDAVAEITAAQWRPCPCKLARRPCDLRQTGAVHSSAPVGAFAVDSPGHPVKSRVSGFMRPLTGGRAQQET